MRIADALAPALPAGSSILVGLSGGVDSAVLLHLLAQIAPPHAWKLSALHVHHGISPRAGEWAEFCRQLCAQYGIPLHIEQVDITPLREKGIEAAARELRHEALARQPADFIALAHHQDDQAETLLLQLLRGAGVKGAAGMPFAMRTTTQTPSPFAGEGDWLRRPVLLRPLLDASRAELLDYAQQHALQWVEDESNADDAYPRNFLRHRVLPLLEERFPACRATLARSARHFAEASELLDELAHQDAQGALDGASLAVVRLVELAPLRAKNLLRYFLHRCGAPMPQAAQLGDMLQQLCGARQDAAVCIAYGGWQVRRYQGRVYAFPAQAEPDAGFCVEWRGETALELPELGGTLHFESGMGLGLRFEKLRQSAVSVRLRHGAEHIRLDNKRPTRTLKNLLQEHGIPPWQRDTLPLLFCGDKLVAIPGIGVECACKAAPEEEGVVLRWERGELCAPSRPHDF